MRGNMVKTKENGQIKKLNKKPVNLRLRPWLIILPTLVVTLGILYPFYQAVFYSLTDYSLKKPVWHFVGLKNWLEMFKGVNFGTLCGLPQIHYIRAGGGDGTGFSDCIILNRKR